MWVGVIMIALVAFDASAFVCYITRFTEENFACLIALIFIKKAIDKVLHIADYYPIFESDCFCQPTNDTLFGQGSVQYVVLFLVSICISVLQFAATLGKMYSLGRQVVKKVL